MSKVDLIIAGSVAVNEAGARVGKAGGYCDLEYAIEKNSGWWMKTPRPLPRFILSNLSVTTLQC
jgi:5-formyltetrahydrofolate cyclo-ligase